MGYIISGDTHLTGEQFNDYVARAAFGFNQLGVGRGDGIAIMLRNEPVFPQANLAAGSVGAYSIPVNWHSVASELNYILEDSGAQVLVIHADLLAGVASGIPAHVKVLVVEPPPEVCAAYGITPQSWELPPDAVLWAAWRDSFPPRTKPAEVPLQTVFYTSGTTGRPKGVKRPELQPAQVPFFNAMLARSYGLTGEWGRPEDITTVATGPIYHGMPNGHTNFSVRAGANLIMMPRFDAEQLLQIIEQHRVTHLAMVPIMFNRLLHLPQAVRERYDHASLRFVITGAAPIAPGVKREMIAWWGNVIQELYGATELGNVAFCTSEEWLAHPGTVGRAGKDIEIRIVGKDGQFLPPNEVGEVVCRMHGVGEVTYINNEKARRDIELAPGLLTAGDIGYLDEDGFLFICDRSKDMIISGGVNIYPAQIEGALHKMPGVEDCAVFGIPNDEYGEAVHAVIELSPGAVMDAAQVMAYLRQHVPGYMVPRSVDFATGLPREDSGKLFKRKLREPFWSNTGRVI